MISDDARREIERASGGTLTMLLEWTSPVDLASVARGSTRAERVEHLRTSLRQLKGPALERLAREEGVAVTDLGAAPQAIVRASPERWRKLASQGGFLADATEVRVVPNVLFHSLETPSH